MRLVSLLSLLSLAAASADPLLSPQEALKKFTAPEGFSVDLIAAEPDIVQPIAFCWDARGRLWVVEGLTYPTRAKDGEGKDRILIFADEDGDGKFETRKVFAEGLNLVSGIELGFGGVYVGAAPYLMFIPDKDGNDQPDPAPPQEESVMPTVPGLKFHAEILLDGWGYQDTHETLNSFIWGPDGWLYGCHGVFTHSNVGAPGTAKDKRTPINCHYWRFHPVRKTFEAYASGTSNSWGFDYNEYGDWFSEACVIPHFWHIIQGGYYLRQSNPLGHFNPYVYTNIETIADHLHYTGATPHSGNGVSDEAGGGHAHCGLCIYNGDNFPPEYRGRAMMFNIHGQRINQEQLVPEGSGYVAKHLPDFVKANDKNFTGVALKVGPDGAVYFIDWYDMQKCHRPQPEVWDRSNGRIYRVKYDRTWKPWKGDVAKQTYAQTAKDAGRQNWSGRIARRLLAEGKIKPVAENDHKALKLLKDYALDQFERTKSPAETYVIPNLWAAIGADLIANKDYAEMVNVDNLSMYDHMQATWIRHLADRNALSLVEPKRLIRYTQIPTDPKGWPAFAQLRLALSSALQRLPLDDRWPIAEALIAHGEDAKDHNLPQMYWYAIEPLVPGNPERALALAEKSKIPLISQHIARRLSETDGGLPHLITALGKEKTAAGTVYLLKAALQGLKGRSGEPAPKGWDGAWANIDDVLARRPDAKPLAAEITDLREAVAVAFGDKRAFPRLRDIVKDAKHSAERRETALQTLLDGKDPEIPSLIESLLDDPVMRLPALKALPRATAK